MERIRKFILTISLALCMCGFLYWGHAAFHVPSPVCQKIYASSKKAYTYQLKNRQLQSVKNVAADLKDADLKIKPSKDGKFYLSYRLYCYNSQNPFTYQVTDGTLRLDGTRLKEAPDNFKKGTITKKRTYITLLVPSKTLGRLVLKAEDADLFILGVSCKDASLSTSYGNIQLSDVNNSGELQLSAEDGDIFLSKTDAGKALRITTRYGDVAAENLTFPKTAGITTSDGDIRLSGSRISDEMQLKTFCGDITADKLTVTGTGTAGFHTEDGDILLSASSISGTVQCKTSYGDVGADGLSVSGTAGINTEYGDINLADADISGLMQINSIDGDVNLRLAEECRKNLNIAMKTQDGSMSVKKYMGGKKKRYHEYGWNYTKSSAESSARLDVVTVNGDLSLQ